MESKSQRVGLSVGILDMFIYGMMPVVSNRMLDRYHPLLFSGFSTLLGSLPILMHLLIIGKAREVAAPRLLFPLLTIALCGAAGSVLFFTGNSQTSAINTGLLQQTEPIYAILIGWLLLKERISKQQLAASMLMLAGALAVVYQGFSKVNSGDLLVLVSPLFFQVAHLVAKRIFHLVSHENVIPAARLLYGGLVLVLCGAIAKPAEFVEMLEPESLFAIAGFAFLFRSLDLFLWYQALRRLPLSKLSALLPVGAGVAFLGSIMFLGERAHGHHLLGLGLIVAGLIWLSRTGSRVS